LHLAAGLTPPDDGSVFVAGNDLGGMRDRDLTLFRRRHIGLVFQSFNLIPTLTAEENVALPLMLDARSRAGSSNGRLRPVETAQALLQELNLGHRLGHRPDAMSGGEQQRVAIARALVTEPALILADEPTGNLDTENGRAVCELLRRLADEGRTIVMVTHEPSVAAYARRVVVLKDGKLIDQFDVRQGEAADVARRYTSAVTA
jgi:putative ABC transport system ATP-binding protein